MDLFETSRREKRQSFVVALALAAVVSVLAAPAVEAALQTVKIKDSGGGAIDAKRIPPMGDFDAPGSSGAVAVRNFAGGGGFLGGIDCTAAADPQSNAIAIPSGRIVTGIIIGGTDAKVTITSDVFGALPLMRLRANAAHPNEFVGLGNGLTTTDNLRFTCTAEGGGAGVGNVIIIGQ